MIEIKPGDIVYVLDTPGAPLARCSVHEVSSMSAVVERFGYGPTSIPRHRVYAIEFGAGCCKTCGHPVSWPYRRRNSHGEIVEGCVDASHDVIPTDVSGQHRENRAWHDRPASVRVREHAAARLAELLTRL